MYEMNFVISPPSLHPSSQQKSSIVKGAVTVNFTNVFQRVELCLTTFFIPVIANLIAKYTIDEFKTGTCGQKLPLDLTFASVSFDASQLPVQDWTLQPHLAESLAEYWAPPPRPSFEHLEHNAVKQIQKRGTYTDFMDKVHEIHNDQHERIFVTRRGFVTRGTYDNPPPPPSDNTTIRGCLLVGDKKDLRTVFETIKELKSKEPRHTMLMIVKPNNFAQLKRDIALLLPTWSVSYVHDLGSFGELIENLKTIDLVVMSQAVVSDMVESLADNQQQPWMFDVGENVPEQSSSSILSKKIIADNIMWDTLIIDDVDDLVPIKYLKYKCKDKKFYLGRDGINLRSLFSSKQTLLLSTNRFNLQSPEHIDTYIYLLGSTTCDGISLFPPHEQYYSSSAKKTKSFQLPLLQRMKLHHLFLDHHVVTTVTCRGQKRKYLELYTCRGDGSIVDQ
jgi:hypothetical protein